MMGLVILTERISIPGAHFLRSWLRAFMSSSSRRSKRSMQISCRVCLLQNWLISWWILSVIQIFSYCSVQLRTVRQTCLRSRRLTTSILSKVTRSPLAVPQGTRSTLSVWIMRSMRMTSCMPGMRKWKPGSISSLFSTPHSCISPTCPSFIWQNPTTITSTQPSSATHTPPSTLMFKYYQLHFNEKHAQQMIAFDEGGRGGGGGQGLRFRRPILEKMSASLILRLQRSSRCFLSAAYFAKGALSNSCFFKSQFSSFTRSDCRLSLTSRTVDPFFLKDSSYREDSLPFSRLVCQSSREYTAEGEQKKLERRAIPPKVSLLDLTGEMVLQVFLVSLLCTSSPHSSRVESSRSIGTSGISRIEEDRSWPRPADSNNSSRFYWQGEGGQRRGGRGASSKASFIRSRYSWQRSHRSCPSCRAASAERQRSSESTPETALRANSCILRADAGGVAWKWWQVAALKREATAAA